MGETKFPKQSIPAVVRSRTLDVHDFKSVIGSISRNVRRKQKGSDAYAFKWTYLSENILSKYVDGNSEFSSEQRADRALKKLLASEEHCKHINDHGYSFPDPGMEEEILSSMAWHMWTLIGEQMDSAHFEQAKFSSGASYLRPRRHGDAYYKYGSKPIAVTPAARKYALAIKRCTPLWDASVEDSVFSLAAGNSVTTVPKKNDIDRCIAKEPEMNQHLQSAVGKCLRKMLRNRGINLNDQSINQRLAQVGSETNSLATLDLSSASDNISRRIVWDCLSQPWYDLLNSLRSHFGDMPDGSRIYWEKFSSMGNNFTFELETAIFWSAAMATAEREGVTLVPQKNFHIYGDDIIVPSSLYGPLVEVLEAIGFAVNDDKSFHDGPFRESCGKHYYDGRDVTPFYIRKPIDNVSRCIWLLNSLREWSYEADFGVCDPMVYRLWVRLRRLLVSKHLLGGYDTSSTESVASPHSPRMKVVRMTGKPKFLNGIRGLLRSFQYSNRVSDPNAVAWITEVEYVSGNNEGITDETLRRGGKWRHKMSTPHVTAVFPDRFCVRSNSDAEWSEVPLFSQEI